MKRETFDLLNKWREKHLNNIKHQGIYVFGSLIYLDGVNFKVETSDLDLVILLDDDYLLDVIIRKQCLLNLKSAKKELEKELLFLWQRKNAKEQIVSILPIFNTEISLDIHKSGVPDFYKNEFENIATGKIESLVTSIAHPESKIAIPKLGMQILQEVQEIRNSYLINSATSNPDTLVYNGSDIIPKKLSRSFAKLNSLEQELPYKGDEFNTSLGLDLLKSTLNTKRNQSEYLELYNWIDNRSGGRSNTTNPEKLECEQHLLAYELLWQLTLTHKKKEDEVLLLSEDFMSFLNSVDILTKAHSKELTLELDDIYVEPTFKSNESKSKGNTDLSFMACSIVYLCINSPNFFCVLFSFNKGVPVNPI